MIDAKNDDDERKIKQNQRRNKGGDKENEEEEREKRNEETSTTNGVGGRTEKNEGEEELSGNGSRLHRHFGPATHAHTHRRKTRESISVPFSSTASHPIVSSFRRFFIISIPLYFIPFRVAVSVPAISIPISMIPNRHQSGCERRPISPFWNGGFLLPELLLFRKNKIK